MFQSPKIFDKNKLSVSIKRKKNKQMFFNNWNCFTLKMEQTKPGMPRQHRVTTKNAYTQFTHIFIALLRDDTIVKLLVFRSIMFMALFK